jgi:NAD-dependent deacetylase
VEAAAAALAEALRSRLDQALLVVTGAGVSSASGIPTFRGTDPGAVWRAHDVELATLDYFLRDPVGQWRWYLERFAAVEAARPNPAHHALARLERLALARGGRPILVTQNIDVLHEVAGTRRLIKIHGSSDRLRCSRVGCEHGAPTGSLPRTPELLAAFRQSPSYGTLPRCPACGELLRAHVLFFDEYYQDHLDYRFDEAMAAGAQARVALFVGTSFSVGITDLLLRALHGRGTPAFSIDPASAPPFHARLTHLRHPAEELLPAVLALLGEGPAGRPAADLRGGSGPHR